MAREIAKWQNAKGWTKTHGFFVIMGGFHLFQRPQSQLDDDFLNPHDDDIPLHPLAIEDLTTHGIFDFTLPTEEEIQDKGKSDWLAKTLVLIQTTWFVMQCIARGVERLPVTELEIVTLAYAMMSFAMYLFWWNKPLNVERPIRVFLISREADAHGEADSTTTPGDNGTSNGKQRVWSWTWKGVKDWLETMVMFIAGVQDEHVTLADEKRVPTFWSGKPDSDLALTGDIITLAVGVIFGGIHCIAWSFSFPSYQERFIWHISSIAMISVPVFMLAWLWMGAFMEVPLFAFVYTLLALASLLYIISRVLTVALAFTCLRSLPPQAYETVHWTTFLPHI